jgi:heme-degrading monooxygenase HmoA
MEQIFIDKFRIPRQAKQEFTEKMNINRAFIKNLPGFIQDSAYERQEDGGYIVCITVAIWESEQALNNAKTAVQAEYQRIGFDPAELLARLDITMERDVYELVG